jgi:hypothetical protein
MMDELIFEAEPFAFEADYGAAPLRDYSARGRAPAYRRFQGETGGGTSGDAPGGAPAAPAPPKPPKGLALLQHFHVPKSLPGGAALGKRVMDPAGMNPGFVDAADELAVNAGADGLHTRLRALLAGKYNKYVRGSSVAVVDLTGKRLFAPDLAGWRSTLAADGASLPKIIVVYAAQQLRFDLQARADQHKLTTKQALLDRVRKEWEAAGLVRSQQPNLDDLFDYVPSSSKPVTVNPSIKLDTIISCIYDDDCNWTASLLIDRLGLGYIGSVLWQSGLFHGGAPQHARGGLWLTGLYRPLTCLHCSGHCCPMNSKIEKVPRPVYVSPLRFGLNVTALSAATYFTLMAQGRLVHDAASGLIRKALESACSIFTSRSDPTPTKCGYVPKDRVFNDVALVERHVGSGPKTKAIRFAIAMTTSGLFSAKAAAESSLFQPLLRDVETLVGQNNP